MWSLSLKMNQMKVKVILVQTLGKNGFYSLWAETMEGLIMGPISSKAIWVKEGDIIEVPKREVSSKKLNWKDDKLSGRYKTVKVLCPTCNTYH